MDNEKSGNIFWKNPITWLCLVGVGYWVYTYHLEHAMGLLPYGILLLCPLMHIFHHGHHGHHSHHEHSGHEDDKHDGGQNAR